ncbi:MAG: hypothetical protein ACLFTJ_09425, partial [Halothece sp.]
RLKKIIIKFDIIANNAVAKNKNKLINLLCDMLTIPRVSRTGAKPVTTSVIFMITLGISISYLYNKLVS